MDLELEGEGMFFTDYCIVCDRAIIQPKPEEPKLLKKKVAGGAIRVKNPDGTVTTRLANGQKVTRPQLRRGPNSANRLAVAAVNNNAASKLQTLTRSKTADPQSTSEELSDEPSSSTFTLHTNKSSSSPDTILIQTPTSSASSTEVAAEVPFVSSIYCSKACAQVEVSRSTDFVRRLSYDLGSPTSLRLITSNLPVYDHTSKYGVGSGSTPKSPIYTSGGGPPSPFFISGSSDSSSIPDPNALEPTSTGIQGTQAATSAPNSNHFSLFAIGKDGADDAWNEIHRQRRSSMHPSFRTKEKEKSTGGVGMSREQSRGIPENAIQSSDSLSSMWNGNGIGNNGNQEVDINVSRSISGSGRLRTFTPLSSEQQHNQRPSYDRSISNSSVTGMGIPIKTSLPRSNLSQVSLVNSSIRDNNNGDGEFQIPPEFGSAPEHTLNLWNDYHISLSHRHSTDSYHSNHIPNSQTPVLTSSIGINNKFGKTPTSPPPKYEENPISIQTSSSSLRRPSFTSSNSVLSRSSHGGTIRASSHKSLRRESNTNTHNQIVGFVRPESVTWDSFGREEIEKKKFNKSSPNLLEEDNEGYFGTSVSSVNHRDNNNGNEILSNHTPKQSTSIKVGKKGCLIRFHTSTDPSQIHLQGSISNGDDTNVKRRNSTVPFTSSGPFPTTSSTTLPSAADVAVPVVGRVGDDSLSIPRNISIIQQNPIVSSSPSRTPKNGNNIRKPSLPPPTQAVPIQSSLTTPQHGIYEPNVVDPEIALSTSLKSFNDINLDGLGQKNKSSSTWNWDKYEKSGGRTYVVPTGLRAGVGKSGLFFFK